MESHNNKEVNSLFSSSLMNREHKDEKHRQLIDFSNSNDYILIRKNNIQNYFFSETRSSICGNNQIIIKNNAEIETVVKMILKEFL